jgi:hypothetical protein
MAAVDANITAIMAAVVSISSNVRAGVIIRGTIAFSYDITVNSGR